MPVWIASVIVRNQLRRARAEREVYPRLEACRGKLADSLPLHAILNSPSTAVSLQVDDRFSKARNTTVYIAVNLHNNADVIPYLFGAIMRACIFMATADSLYKNSNCFISVYESGSSDETRDLLKLVGRDLKRLGIPSHIVLDGIERNNKKHRIEFLAAIRNKALEPFFKGGGGWDEVLFLNDVVVCANGLLELLIEKQSNAAHVVSGMDYFTRGKRVRFYDTWVNKDISGRGFKNRLPYIQHEQSWQDYKAGTPFQVFTTWAGGVIISGSFFRNLNLKFRHSGLLECASCECELLIRDLWHASGESGLRVVVVPRVFVSYNVHDFLVASDFLWRKFPKWEKRKPTTKAIKFTSSPPDTFECCGMEFAGEQVVNFGLSCTSMPWRWWYAPRVHAGVREILSNTTKIFQKSCQSVDPSVAHFLPNRRNASASSPELLHFIIDTDDPRKLPNMALAHMLEWSRLNPCFGVRIHHIDDLFTLTRQASVHWGEMISKIEALPDTALTLTQHAHLRRVLGYVVIYLYGGIIADLEVLPTRPLPLHLLNRPDSFEIVFDKRAYGGGPILTVAPARTPMLEYMINLSLKRAMMARHKIQFPSGLQHRKRLSSQLDRVASWTVGLQLYKAIQQPVRSQLESYVQLRGYKRKVRSLAHSSAEWVAENEILWDGEFIVSSPSTIRGTVVWSSPPSNLTAVHSEDSYLTLQSALRKHSNQGCLEIVSASSGARTQIHCWRRSQEIGKVIYMAVEHGVLRVYASNKSSCDGSAERQILFTSPTAQHSTSRSCFLHCHVYVVQLSLSGSLQLVLLTVHRWHEVFRANQRQNMCLIDLNSSPKCLKNDAIHVALRQLIRYRDGCSTIL